MHRLGLADKPRVRKLIVAVLGGTIVVFGLALIILPGPAVIVLPVGLAVLATEFTWARRLVRRGGLFVGRARRWQRRRKIASSLGHDQA